MEETVLELVKHGFAAFDPAQRPAAIAPTAAGREMARFYVRFKTARAFTRPAPKMGKQDVLWALATAEARLSAAAAACTSRPPRLRSAAPALLI